METDLNQPLMYSEVSSKRHRDVEEEMDDDANFVDSMKKKRMPAGEDIGPKLVHMIKKLDDDLNGISIEKILENLASTLEQNMDPYEGQIIHIIFECAAYLPEKITIFSTLVGILNSRSSEFGERLLSKFMEELQNTFLTEEYDISIRIITFLCDLCNSCVVTLSSVLDFLEDLLDLASDDNIKSDFFIYAVLHTLPWIGPRFNENMPTRLSDMLDRIGAYLEKRKKYHVKILQVWSDPSFPQEDYLDSLWKQLQKLKQADWLEKQILRTYTFFDTILNGSVQHELPIIDRNIMEESTNHPLPRVIFHLFRQSDCVDNTINLPSEDSIERYLVQEDLNWIIDNNYTDWKLCASALLNYHRKETIPLNYMIIETIFSQLFRCPNSPHLEVFYGALLIELCRSQSNSMPQVLALAAEMLFQRVDTMQPICLDRFVDWFSYHLSNFEYRWSWSDWAECVELDSLHPKRIFVREVIDKCMRFSYQKKLFDFLPKEFAPIIPDEPNINYILDDDRHPAYDKAEHFKELIMLKKGDEDILTSLENIKNDPVDEDSEKTYSPNSLAIFFAVLLKLSSKTLTHSFAALTRYHKTLCRLANGNEEMQSTILRTLYDSWASHKQMMTVLVDKMIKMKILEPAIVQAWVFSDEMKVEFKRTWVWEVLSSAMKHLERQRNNLIRTGEACSSRLKRLQEQKDLVPIRSKAEIVAVGMENDEANKNEEDGLLVSDENIERPRITAPRENEGQQMELDEAVDGNADDYQTNFDEKILKVEEQLKTIADDLEHIEEILQMVLLNICHKFTLILTEHILNCETDGTEIETNFYNYVTGRFKYVFLKHADSMWKFQNDLDRELFSTATIEPRICQIFEQFKSLRH